MYMVIGKGYLRRLFVGSVVFQKKHAIELMIVVRAVVKKADTHSMDVGFFVL